jgi:NitT/TauT family transport system ATP-binding protein
MDAPDPIVFENVDKSYESPPVNVVQGLSLRVHRGEFFCLVGPSGCGKSTTLKLIAGIERPTSGAIYRPKRVGMVFQSFALLPWLNVEDNVAFAPRMQRLDDELVAEITARYLRMVHLEAFAKKFPRQLSGGQRQRVGIARALAVDSDVLLMDEPFSSLDPMIVDELHEDVLAIWSETKKTIVMVSHHFEEAVLLADRVGVMRGGRLTDLIEVALPRPRDQDQAPFMLEVKKIRDCLSSAPA